MTAARAPGRVNLIGEHTDHAGGLVMPVAIQLATTVSARPRQDRQLVVYSEAFHETALIAIDRRAGRSGRWSDYVAGVVVELLERGYDVEGADLRIQSSVPCGAGLSSSAALEVATAYALLREDAATVDRLELAELCQRAENHFVGAQCGIMDQYVACFGQADEALLIDCRALTHRRLPWPAGLTLVVCDTKVKHSIAGGEYNARRADCESALQVLRTRLPSVTSLRDVTLDDLREHAALLSPDALKRARHVVSENARVLQAAAALERGDLDDFGVLMAGSHRSLKEDYEVSCAELDCMVELAAAQRGVIGTRMTGGGFGGCTVCVVEKEHARAFVAAIESAYRNATGIRPDVWVCVPSRGVHEISESPDAA